MGYQDFATDGDIGNYLPEIQLFGANFNILPYDQYFFGTHLGTKTGTNWDQCQLLIGDEGLSIPSYPEVNTTRGYINANYFIIADWEFFYS